jgi:two-component system response regulator FixJ
MLTGTTPFTRTRVDTQSTGEPKKPALVYIVEDEIDLREMLVAMVRCAGFSHVACASARQALDSIAPEQPGCVLIDLYLPDMNGLELRRRLVVRNCHQPFLVVSGSKDIGLAIQSLQDGAVDFLQKPFSSDRLLKGVARAMRREEDRRRLERRISALTDRELEILWLMTEGRSTKEIATVLGISARTVDVHRYHVLRKMEVPTVVHLVRSMNGYKPPARHESYESDLTAEWPGSAHSIMQRPESAP